jgi:hypothetical protein
MKGFFQYVNQESLRDLHLAPNLQFNQHVPSSDFIAAARVIYESEGTLGFLAMQCGRNWGNRFIIPSTATVKELVDVHNIPLEV